MIITIDANQEQRRVLIEALERHKSALTLVCEWRSASDEEMTIAAYDGGIVRELLALVRKD